MNDLRYAVRTLRSSPTFTLAALVVLAIGIGANSAMFALTDAVLLKPLPVTDPSRLVVLGVIEADDPDADFGFSYAAYKDIRDGVSAFSGVLASSGIRLNVSHSGQNERCSGEIVTGNYFTTLGVRPTLGRLLAAPDDAALGAHPVVVLDYAFWRHLGADPELVGRDVLVNGRPMIVLGVTPADFYGTDLSRRPQLYVPMAMAPVLRPNLGDPTLSNRNHSWLKVMARLQPNVSADRAMAGGQVVFHRSVLAAIDQSRSMSENSRRRAEASRLTIRPGAQGPARMRHAAQLPILLLFGATIALLLVACANLANLLLARGATRSREFALRSALGGSQWRIVRQLLVESLVLSMLAGGLGLIVASWTTGPILRFMPEGTGLGTDLAPDARVIAVTFGISLVAGLLFGLGPALRTTSHDPAVALKTGVPTDSTATRFLGLRSILIAAQVAMSFVLLVGAGLFLLTLGNLQHLDTGFARDHVLVATLDPSLSGYDDARSASLLTDFVHRVEAIPGVKRAGLSSVSPITGSWDVNSLAIPGYQPKDGEEVNASFAAVSPGYLEAMGIVLRTGRFLTWQDTTEAPAVAVINETMAREYFGGAAVGRHISLDDGKTLIEIVGVVRDGKYVNLREDRAPRFAYVPFLQAPLSGADMVLHARVDDDPLRLVGAVKAQLRALDPTLPLSGITTLEAQIADSLSAERILATLGTTFGILALLLATVGVYGVVAFAVACRTREIGVRMALGARPAAIAGLIVRHMAIVCAAALAAGAACAWPMQGALTKILYGVRPADATVLAGGVVLIAVAAVLGAWMPARRAARLDPLAALRQE